MAHLRQVVAWDNLQVVGIQCVDPYQLRVAVVACNHQDQSLSDFDDDEGVDHVVVVVGDDDADGVVVFVAVVVVDVDDTNLDH